MLQAFDRRFQATVPTAAPTDVVVTVIDAKQVSVAFTPIPESGNGGSPIKKYEANCDGPNSKKGKSKTGSPIAVKGLKKGGTYTCTVRAKNALGYGPPSVPSAPVQASSVPTDAPTAVVAVATGDPGRLSVSFTEVPGSGDGGLEIKKYTASCSPVGGGDAGSKDDKDSPIEVKGLADGVAYTCTVAAQNSLGDGPASAPSAQVSTPGVPGAPTGVSASAGKKEATVSFSAPASDGGNPISKYTARCTKVGGGDSSSKHDSTSPITVKGLTKGSTYTCTVSARNAVGDGPPSAPSNAVIPT